MDAGQLEFAGGGRLNRDAGDVLIKTLVKSRLISHCVVPSAGHIIASRLALRVTVSGDGTTSAPNTENTKLCDHFEPSDRNRCETIVGRCETIVGRCETIVGRCETIVGRCETIVAGVRQ